MSLSTADQQRIAKIPPHATLLAFCGVNAEARVRQCGKLLMAAIRILLTGKATIHWEENARCRTVAQIRLVVSGWLG